MENKFREFWIVDNTDNSGYLAFDRFEREKHSGACNRFRVVEYAAVEQLKAEIKSLEEDCVTMREHQALQIENNNFRAEITALKSKLAKAVEYIQNETRCEKTALPSRNGVDLIHTDDCRKCAFLKEIGEL